TPPGIALRLGSFFRIGGKMYCPSCATHNSDDAKFCRACGTNLSLVPQAITGQLKLRRRKHNDPQYLERAGMAAGITQLFMGLGFLMVSLALGVSRSGRGWWFWLLVPAFMFLGRGVAMIVSAIQQ